MRRLVEVGSADAADQLVELAGERGDLDELRRLAERGNRVAADQLVELAAEREDLDELIRLAERGNHDAADVTCPSSPTRRTTGRTPRENSGIGDRQKMS